MLLKCLFSIFGKSVWGPLELTAIGTDITDNIPSNHPTFGVPTATPRTDPASSRALPVAMEGAAAKHPGLTESGQNHGFPENIAKS